MQLDAVVPSVHFARGMFCRRSSSPRASVRGPGNWMLSGGGRLGCPLQVATLSERAVWVGFSFSCARDSQSLALITRW